MSACQRRKCLLPRGHPIPLVDLVKIDVVRVQATQPCHAALNEGMAREALVIRTAAHRATHLGSNQPSITLAPDRLADELHGKPARILVCSVDEIDTGVATHVQLTSSTSQVGRARRSIFATATEGQPAQRQRGDAHPALCELTVIHAVL